MFILILKNFLKLSSVILAFTVGNSLVFADYYTVTPYMGGNFSTNTLDGGNYINDNEEYFISGLQINWNTEKEKFSFEGDFSLEYMNGNIIFRKDFLLTNQMKYNSEMKYTVAKGSDLRINIDKLFYKYNSSNLLLKAGFFSNHISPVSVWRTMFGISLTLKETFFKTTFLPVPASFSIGAGNFQKLPRNNENFYFDLFYGENRNGISFNKTTYAFNLGITPKNLKTNLFYISDTNINNYGFYSSIGVSKIRLSVSLSISDDKEGNSHGFADYGEIEYSSGALKTVIKYGESSGYNYDTGYNEKQFYYTPIAPSTLGGMVFGGESVNFSSLKIAEWGIKYGYDIINLSVSAYGYWNNTEKYFFEFNDYSTPKPMFLGHEENIMTEINLYGLFLNIKYGLFFPGNGLKNIVEDHIFWHYRDKFGYETAVSTINEYETEPVQKLEIMGGIRF